MADRLRWRDRLGTRLGAAFVVTAVVAVVAATAGAVVAAGAELDRLAEAQRSAVVDDVRAALVAAYTAAGGWEDADLLPAHALAASAGAVLVVTTPTGQDLPVPAGAEDLARQLGRRVGPVGPSETPTDAPGTDGPAPAPGRSPQEHGEAPEGSEVGPHGDDVDDDHGGGESGAGGSDGSGTGGAVERGEDGAMRPASTGEVAPAPIDLFEEERTAVVVVEGEEVGTASLLFTEDPRDALAAVRRALTRNLGLAGAAAAVLGLATAMWVLPRLTRPVRRLTEAVTGIAAGDWEARRRLPPAVGELGVLARSVEAMAADLERQERLRRALVADVAHEVRTPLAVLLGEVEALEDGVAEPDADHLASLHEEVMRLARLVEDLDAIAAAESAGTDLRRAPVDLAVVTRGAMAGLEETAAVGGVELVAAVEPVTVDGDARRLEQIVRNLLTNAVKFSPAGGRVTVRVSAAGGQAVLEVVDDGPGIPPDELPHVFERFWRGAGARATVGSGVGLAVVAELAAAHGGQVTADNAPGRGARLTVRLPRVPVAASARDRPSRSSSHPGSRPVERRP